MRETHTVKLFHMALAMTLLLAAGAAAAFDYSFSGFANLNRPGF